MGIFDFLTPQQSQGGILGPQINPTLGILASSLQDAGAQFAGRPEAAYHLNQQIQLQRQQQAQQALQNTPYGGDAQGYLQALVRSGVPVESAIQAASGMRNLQGVKTLTPEEAKAAGFRAGSVVQQGPGGQYDIAQASDMRSPEAAQQAIDIQKAGQILPPEALAQKIQIEKASQAPQWAALAEKQREFQLSNPLLAGGGAGGAAPSMNNLPVGVRNTIQSMLDGRMAPPTAMALKTPYWQNMMNIANSLDPNFDQTAWGARFSARKDFMGGGKSYQTLNAGNTAIQHLGRLYDQSGDVAGHQIPLIGNMLNSTENAITQASGVPGVNAYNDTLGHLAEETTKFYRGAGGAEADVNRNMGNLSANLSSSQKQAGVANTVHLIYGKLAPMVEQYNKTMGTNYPASHFLSGDAVKTIKRMGYDPDTGDKLQSQSAAPPSAQNLPRLPQPTKTINGKTYVQQNGKWYEQ